MLHGGAAACLAGLTAAEAAGLKVWEREPVHIAVPKGVRVPPLAGLAVHESRRLEDSDVYPVRQPPQTRIARALVEAATWLPNPEQACALLAAGVQQRLVQVPALREELERAGRVRHTRILRLALDDIEGGAHSLAEIDVVRLCRRAGLRPPDHQQLRLDSYKKRRYLDAVWTLPDGDRLVLEIDGGLHLEVTKWQEDLTREREVVLAVGRVLRCSSIEARLRPEVIGADLARAGVPARVVRRNEVHSSRSSGQV